MPTTAGSLDGYYTIKEAAAYLNTSVANIAKHVWTKRDLVPDLNFNGRQLLFRQTTLDAFKHSWKWRQRKALR